MQVGKSVYGKRSVHQYEWKLLLFAQVKKFSEVIVK